MSKLDGINNEIQTLRAQGHLTAEQKTKLAQLYTMKQKEVLNEQIRQELIAKNTGTPTPAPQKIQSEEIKITGLSLEKGPDKAES